MQLVFHSDQTVLVDLNDINVMLNQGLVQAAEASASKIRQVGRNFSPFLRGHGYFHDQYPFPLFRHFFSRRDDVLKFNVDWQFERA